jgi:hypothetical protein
MLPTIDIEDMIDHPEKYGFSWVFGSVSKGGQGDKGTVVCAKAPFMKHENVDLIHKTFGPRYFLDSADTTSPRVRDQRVVRDACADDYTIRKDTRELQRMVIRGAFGQKGGRKVVERIVEKRIYIASDDTEFSSKEDMQAYEADLRIAGSEEQDEQREQDERDRS